LRFLSMLEHGTTRGFVTVDSNLVMYEEEFERITLLLNRLRVDASAKIVFLVDKNGQQIAGAGEIDQVDMTSLASLTVGNVAATDGLAKLIGEKEFSILFHEGRKDNIHISIVGQRLILVVIFDERSSLGLVRLRVRKASADIERILSEMEMKAQQIGASHMASPFAEITDEDIDALFSE
jgi:predicted regulator of Ras-like GTPase activity (Roadblock/LC7/MglB family)